jgi:hypothetical protein
VDSIASISGRLAVLEDAMKIIKGEVKQVFTEIRAAILVTAVRDLLPGERSSPRQIKPITRDTGVGTLIRHMLLSRNYRRRLHARPTGKSGHAAQLTPRVDARVVGAVRQWLASKEVANRSSAETT